MSALRQLTLFAFAITVFSSCSFTRNTGGGRRTATLPARDSAQTLVFLDDISLDRNGHSSTLRSGAYHSEPPPAAPAAAAATDLQRKYAGLLEVAPGDISNPSLFRFIDEWWGTPYRYGGETRSGIDCSAFSQLLYAAVFGIGSIPRTAQEQYEDSRKIKKTNRLKEGDLVFFRIHSRRISHVGVYLQNNKFVHASYSAGVTIGDLTDRYWQRYFVCGGEPAAMAARDSLSGALAGH